MGFISFIFKKIKKANGPGYKLHKINATSAKVLVVSYANAVLLKTIKPLKLIANV